VTLHLDLAAVARRGRLAASLLELVPFLRTHTLAVFIKPGID
jgi:hypothetical protein